MNAGLTKIAPLVRAAPKRTFVRPSMPVKGGQHYTFEPNSGPSGKHFPRINIAIGVGSVVFFGTGIIVGAAKFQNHKHGFTGK